MRHKLHFSNVNTFSRQRLCSHYFSNNAVIFKSSPPDCRRRHVFGLSVRRVRSYGQTFLPRYIMNVRWPPSVPDFPRQSRFLTCPVKNYSSPGTPTCSVFGLVSRICPDLPISAAICWGLTHRWLLIISSDFICIYEKSLAAGDAPGPRWRLGAHDAPQTPKSNSPTARACGVRTLRIRFVSSAVVPYCGAEIIWSPYMNGLAA